MTGRRWWHDAVVYQIYPRSFCDLSGDGVGDLAGIAAHLDHVADLGVDALWLSPVFPSPMADFGYDVADYCGIDPLFGDLDRFDALVGAAHQRGLKVVLDWVPNHTSDAHPWFVEARSSRHQPRRDWYIWRDDRPDSAGGTGPPGSPGRVPNNWKAAFPGVGRREFPPAWTYDPDSGQWYLHLFLDRQPDLNWAHPEVQAAMADTLRFWLERGVDGFRMDVIHDIGKDAALADLPADLAAIPMCALIDYPVTHDLVAGIRAVVKSAPPPDRVVIGEIVLPTVAQVASYHGRPERPELDLAFNFHPLHAPWSAGAWRRQIDDAAGVIEAAGGWPTWVLSNHDNRRHHTRYGTEARARAAAVLLLTLRGTPFLYAGEELGLADAEIPPGRQVDPGGRDGCRAPLPWDGSPGHGWAGRPWLPWPPEAAAGRTVAGQSSDPGSTLNLYRRLLAARRASPALTAGTFEWLGSGPGALAYWRSWPGATPTGSAAGSGPVTAAGSGSDQRVVAVNFGDSATWAALPPGGWVVEVGTSVVGEGAGRRWQERVELTADEAVLLRPGGEGFSRAAGAAPSAPPGSGNRCR